MKRVTIALFFAATLASGQKLELGAAAGFGAFGADDVSFRKFVNAGVEACGWCSGRFALFGEYTHWEHVGKKFLTRITRSDLAAAGLRIQGGGRVRPFGDIGLAGGQDRYVYPGGSGVHNLLGIVGGGGVAIALGERWYVRPQYRLYALSGYHLATGGSVGVGFRF